MRTTQLLLYPGFALQAFDNGKILALTNHLIALASFRPQLSLSEYFLKLLQQHQTNLTSVNLYAAIVIEQRFWREAILHRQNSGS